MDQVLQTFIAESRELLAEMETALLGIADSQDLGDGINAIFRAAHTIKGSAGLFGIHYIVDFAHGLESVLDRIREGEITPDDALIALLLASHDTLGRLVGLVEAKAEGPDDELAQEAAELSLRLSAYLATNLAVAGDTEGTQKAATDAATNAATNAANNEPDTLAPARWHLSLRFHEGVLRNGMDPLSFLRYLQRLGEITGVACQAARLPVLDALDPEACYLGVDLGLISSATRATLAGTFDFVADDCDIHLLGPDPGLADFATLLHQLAEPTEALGERLLACGSVTAADWPTLLAQATSAAVDDTPPPQATVLLKADAAEAGPAAPVSAAASTAVATAAPATGTATTGATATSAAASAASTRPARERTTEERSVRVDAAKLDHLINLVGELITASAGATLAAARAGNAELQTANVQVADLVEAVRDSTLQLRMVKIGATFGRFRRVVHDVARQLGKRIDLDVRGEDTELDKTVVERIGDPLTHLVRNAMDHGIESAEKRRAAGKPEHGTITLDAHHDSGHIVITVQDDGQGLDRERILAKARERGLIDDERVLSERDIHQLIFEPGFSTAAAVTDLSGRGVGMDVVKRNITALRGTVEVSSRIGLGTTVLIRLPLTLAIIDGFQVGVGASHFVLPLDMVDECVAYSSDAQHHYIDLRGQVLPFLRLREIFRLPGQPAGRENIVVVRHAGQRIGLVVDTLLGETQSVIKPLSRVFAKARGISGSSILGSGDVALILDVPALMQAATQGFDPATVRSAASAADAPPVSLN